jgi:hypothetical protein
MGAERLCQRLQALAGWGVHRVKSGGGALSTSHGRDGALPPDKSKSGQQRSDSAQKSVRFADDREMSTRDAVVSLLVLVVGNSCLHESSRFPFHGRVTPNA